MLRSLVPTGSVLSAGAVLLTAALLTPAPASADPGDCAGQKAPAAPTGAPPAPVANADTASVLGGDSVEIPVLANDSVSAPTTVVYVRDDDMSDSVCVEADGSVFFSPGTWTPHQATFTYGITDGSRFSSATVTVSVVASPPVDVRVARKLKGSRPAKLVLTNPSDRTVKVLVGGPQEERPDKKRFLAPHASATVQTRRERVAVVASTTGALGPVTVSAAKVDTRKGKVRQLDVLSRKMWR